MRLMKKLAFVAAIAAMSATSSFAEEYTKGVVKKVNPEKGKVTVIHEEIVNLEMPAMTMVFRTAEEEMLEQMQPGDNIEFVVERVDGKLTITKLKE